MRDCFGTDQLSHTGDLKGGVLDEIGDRGQMGVIGELGKSRADNARAGNTDVDYTVWFADAVEAPAINGLSSGALQNTTSLAAPMHCRSLVSSAASLITTAHHATASILMPALVEPMLTDEQTKSVSASARGMDAMSSRSPALKALLYERAIAADKVDADRLGSTIKCLGVFDRIAAADRDEHRDRSNADALINDGNTVFFRDLLAGSD